ncbi:MAG: DUF4336 domain-containing protein [Myxococcota bacterium]
MRTSPLQPFGDGLWICDGPRVRLLTIPFATRMTVVETTPGSLWVHSPFDPTPGVGEAVDALGTVRWIVAPNKIHSLGVVPWKERYPEAEVWVSPGFRDRHPKLPADHVIGTGETPAWADAIEAHVFQGNVILDEVVFFHARSKALILTDLIQRHDPALESWFWRLVKGWVGVLGDSGGTARDLRSTFRDRDAARVSAEALLRWDFDRVVISHGSCITQDTRATVERAFAWALA